MASKSEGTDLKISGDGRPGQSGVNGASLGGRVLAFGGKGADGGHATVPIGGDDALTVHVEISRPDEPPEGTDRAGFITQTVDIHRYPCQTPQPHSVQMYTATHDLGRSGRLLLSAAGGDGGHGAHGGHGQAGGNGQHGEDATRYSRGSDGQAGGNGGDAGHGTSGANGGKAGQISVWINEADMDLLLTMPPPRMNGGAGGQAGTNGIPGVGGNGGDGGASYTWTTTYRSGDRVYTQYHTNPGGVGGAAGRTGKAATAVLQPGQPGESGRVDIYLQRNDRTVEGPFPSSYNLEISDFTIIDGNDDGIYEFGDIITLANLKVINRALQSPSMSQVTVHANESPRQWLVAPNTRLVVPRSILGGQIVDVSGTFTFRIKRPTDLATEQSLIADDGVHLGAYMSGIERLIGGFHSPRPIVFQHPVVLGKPRYLKCVTPGQVVLFKWRVTNHSTKPLGEGSSSARKIVLAVRDGMKQATIGDTTLDSGDATVNLLNGGATAAMQHPLKIKSEAVPYTRNDLRVSLHLSPPDGTSPDLIQQHDMPIQVSNIYQYNPEAHVLLVTNVNTTAAEVNLWQQRCTSLGLQMDVWNVSLNGHLELTGGHPHRLNSPSKLFELYQGKTIVMLGNSFPYFERGTRTAIDLIDHTDFAPAAVGGTSLFVCGSSLAQNDREHLARHLRRDLYPRRLEFKTVKLAVKAIFAAQKNPEFSQTIFVILPAIRGEHAQRCAQKAARVQNELHRRLPNQRFIVTWTRENDNSKGRAGEIQIMPATAYGTGKLILTGQNDSDSETVNTFALTLLIAFDIRLDILWNYLGGSSEKSETQSIDVLIDTLEYEILLELGRFIHSNPPWPDCIQQEEIFSQLSRLNAFFTYNAAVPFSNTSVARIVRIIGNIRLLADCCPGFWPKSLTFATRRKRLRKELDWRIDLFLKSHYRNLGENVAIEQFKKYIKEKTAALRLKNVPNRKETVLRSSWANVPIENSGSSNGITDFEMKGNISKNHGESIAWQTMDRRVQLQQDLTHAKAEVDELSRTNFHF